MSEPDPRELWWENESHPQSLLEFLRPEIHGRKCRLFLCACARNVEDKMPGAGCRSAIDAAEAFADKQLSAETLSVAAERASGESDRDLLPRNVRRAADVAVFAATPAPADMYAMSLALIQNAAESVVPNPDSWDTWPTYLEQCDLLRDIFGNPFRPVPFDDSWRTSTTVALATQMYESRDFGAMPILADALQDAGCESDNILNHCRSAYGIHVRGCWVVDLVLGKS